MSFWRGRRERGTAVVVVTVPTALEVRTGRLLETRGGEQLVVEDDAGETRTVARAQTYRATPDQMARLRSIQVTEHLLREQIASLLTEMEPL